MCLRLDGASAEGIKGSSGKWRTERACGLAACMCSNILSAVLCVSILTKSFLLPHQMHSFLFPLKMAVMLVAKKISIEQEMLKNGVSDLYEHPEY